MRCHLNVPASYEYGLQLDLDLLDTLLVADESALQRQIEETREAIQDLQGRIEQQEVLLARRGEERATRARRRRHTTRFCSTLRERYRSQAHQAPHRLGWVPCLACSISTSCGAPC
ncbi:hypothetical protein [Paraburkholderia sp. GAS348]|uniref:hypothetical protein n=1 Tax=Paraburkholderia sp. GAS348 TaxID=3035132 RepID=UPI003D1AC6AF